MNYPNHFLLWAKTERGTGKIHRLVYHMIDVGEVTAILWKLSFPKQTRELFNHWLGSENNDTGNLLAYFTSLHDIGKAAPGFQIRNTQQKEILERAGFSFPTQSINPATHGVITAWALENLLSNEGIRIPKADARSIARALGGHHGTWPTPENFLPAAIKMSDKGNGLWDFSRKELFQELQKIFKPPEKFHLPENINERNAFITLLSGLISVADWIGSIAELFPFDDNFISREEYHFKAEKMAVEALKKLGWIANKPFATIMSFDQMFKFYPNPTQREIIGATNKIHLPAMVIIEAPTGIGKTEAAFYLADQWMQAQSGQGTYIAMPTQATSNQMFCRFVKFLENRYPGEIKNVQLVHAAALLTTSHDSQPQNIYDEGKTIEGGIRAETWFLPRKRTLLAPFGVGTVDQALMSVLQTRHFFVRLFGLGQKVIIFDEIHAYDTYMSELFKRLLTWLRSINSSVILLSATLPECTRNQFAQAWSGDKAIVLQKTNYPRLTIVSPGDSKVIVLPVESTRTIQLKKIGNTVEPILDDLKEKIKDGGCIAVICNRVARAQEIYKEIRKSGIIENDQLILFHARFPFGWRDEKEKQVIKLFGKNNGERPKRVIVVATQVIEQSLDLDFDYMISDLAPIDLLIQRAGRLHRHSENDETRPEQFQTCKLIICYPPDEKEIPEFGKDEWVYERSVLLHTWLILKNKEEITLPKETNDLIECVYSDLSPSLNPDPEFEKALKESDDRRIQQINKELFEARKRIIARPDNEELTTNKNENLEEDDPEINKAFQAMTRLIEPSITLICLYQTPNGLALDVNGKGASINLNKIPDNDLTKKLLMQSVSVQWKNVIDYFVNHDVPPWREKAALRHHYLAVFDTNGICRLGNNHLTLKLDREIGLEIYKEEE